MGHDCLNGWNLRGDDIAELVQKLKRDMVLYNCFFEKSTQIFHEKGMHYIHRGRTVFDTGLKMELLQGYCLVALDVFREKPYPKDKTEQTAWIAFLATDSLRQAEELAIEFPWLKEIYAEMAEYLYKPEELQHRTEETQRQNAELRN